MVNDHSRTSTAPRAAMYLRISQDREMDGPAIDRQREDCEERARLRRWQVIEPYYIDQSRSAYDRYAERPEYERMVRDYEAGLIDAIVCWDLDRLTRMPRELEDWIERAEFCGLVLVTANGDADLSTDGGRMYARIKAAVARAEMERKAERQSRAQRQRAMLGKPPKGMRPLGYALDGSVIEPEADIVRAIYNAFTKAENPESLRSIARALSNSRYQVDGIVPTPTHSHAVSVERAEARKAEGLTPHKIKPDRAWSPSTVLGILRNPRYAGYSTYTPKVAIKGGLRRRTWRAVILKDDAGVPIKARWEPIVTPKSWERAQEILDRQDRITSTSGSTKRKHLGSGLYRCGICGALVTGAPRGYRCGKHVVPASDDDPGVRSLMRSGEPIDDFVTEVVAARLRDQDAVRRVQAPDVMPATQALKAEVSAQRARIMRAERDYDDGNIQGRDLKRVRDAAEQQIAELELELRAHGVAGVLQPLLGTPDPGRAFREASLDVRRSVIDALVVVTLQPWPRGKKAPPLRGDAATDTQAAAAQRAAFIASIDLEWRGSGPNERGETAAGDLSGPGQAPHSLSSAACFVAGSTASG